jgi:hypothetical protein
MGVDWLGLFGLGAIGGKLGHGLLPLICGRGLRLVAHKLIEV